MLIISVVPTAAFAETGAGTATPQQSNEDLSEATIEIEKTTYTFNGKAHEPGVTVSLGTRTLKEGKDYKVS